MSWIWISKPNSERPIDFRLGQGLWCNVKDKSRLEEEIISTIGDRNWQVDHIDGDVAYCEEK